MKKSISSIVVFCFMVVNSGCYSIHLVEREELSENPDYPIFAVITSAGDYIEFEPDATLKDSMIVGTMSGGPSVELELASVDSIYVKKSSKVDEDDAKLVCGLGVLALVVIAIIAVSNWISEKVQEFYGSG